ncbi:MAG: glycoside hydrolase family 31, partial [Propionibacteriaceae bacterium]|nr:glycoside hydrolase family 31 [Propionibacteriaceae bacterium]
FSGPIPDAELYLRAMAASTFVPIMQYHSEFNHHRQPSRDRTPWNIADQTGDRSVIDEVRQLVQLRERLIPYLADQAHTTIATARPLMRPLYFDHPRDPLVWEHPIQWSLGDDLLVAPVLEAGRTSWPVYLPDGQWVNVWTGEAVQSGLLEVEAPRPRIPVFARQSAWAELEAVFEG